jgi:hypothetical protein
MIVFPPASAASALGKVTDVCSELGDEEKYKYFDDLSIVELVLLGGLLTQYNFQDHVASDISTEQLYLPPSTFKMQQSLDNVAKWTEENKMLLNEEKSGYTIFTRSKSDFTTRLSLNNKTLKQTNAVKILGVWLTEDLSFEYNTKQICIKAYQRVSMLTKLKYVGVSTEDLINIYILFIRSVTEYCSVLFHTSLTKEQEHSLEKIQAVCLKVILGDNYISYEVALEMSGLEKLSTRRQRRMLQFSLKCIEHPENKRFFPPAEINHEYNTRKQEKFFVNFARTKSYQQSTIPQCQAMLNQHFSNINPN